MRKLLLGTAAVALGMSFVAAEANAQVKLDVGGYTKLYGTWVDQDEQADDPDTPVVSDATNESVDVRELDMARDTEIHFTGETTLDNGLTVGFHTEAEADGSDSSAGDSFDVQESYAYFSGAWGRVNFGAEDGAAYLLQVAAPSADSNYDGLRQFVNPTRHTAFQTGDAALAGVFPDDSIMLGDIFGGGAGSVGAFGLDAIVLDTGAQGTTGGDVRLGNNRGVIGAVSRALDYDHAVSGYDNKITYMTPVFNGFQAGASYTPELGTGIGGSGLAGNNVENNVNDLGEVYDLAARWEGMLGQLGVAFGGGWTHAELERDTHATPDGGCGNAVFYVDADADGNCDVGEVSATRDDREAWNVGLDLDWGAFGLGGAYTEDDNGVSGDELETETWVVGIDYTTGPFKLGASYLTQDQAFGGAELEQDRWTGGVIYTYGPGMTFRGSISYTDYEENLGERDDADDTASSEADATTFLLGTQINF